MDKKRSLQEIEDFYVNKELAGDDLREALEKDKEYQEILKERRQNLTKKFNVSEEEKTKYVLSTDEDYAILGKIHELEQLPLNEIDRELIVLLRTQLEDDWRGPIIKALDKLLGRYKNGHTEIV